MDEILRKIRAGVLETFPDAEGIEITLDTKLGDIPEWDSIAAVNLQTYLQETFPVRIPLDLMSDETTIGELTTFIGKRTAK
ncbi:MAG: acyl carrier protein [Syntrophaceae bacterium]|nr:acyl carrier protein [Syntrophaceae bacterium]